MNDCKDETEIMNLNVVKNAKRNMVFGVLNRLVAVLCPFLTRTFIQYILGEEYLGLGSLFQSILSVLSLAELGFGAAIIYSMYKPVAEGDTKLVNALLNFYRKAYAVVGLVILMVGLALIPFLPHLITGSYPKDISLVMLYMVYLGNTVISYFMYAYMSSLIVVFQRDDINSSTNMIMTLLLNVTQIFMLLQFKDYLLFSIMMPVFTVANNVRIVLVVKKMFPQYHCSGKVPREVLANMKKQVAGTLISKMCQVARNSFDSICISAFLGLALTAMYNNYYYIISAVSGFMLIFSTSLTGGIGNHSVTRSKMENFRELKELDFVYMWGAGWCTVCILCLSQPFMRLWMGENMMLSNSVVVLLCIYFYLAKVGDMRSIYVDVNGLWWEQRWRSLAEAMGNIILNILLAKFFGMYGIILATIITIFVLNQLWGSRITFRCYFGSAYIKEYFLYHFKYGSVTVILCVATWIICGKLPEMNLASTLLIRTIICVMFPNLIYLVLYHKSPCFSRVKSIIRRE